MITAAQIQRVSDEIARKFQPQRIILFGSYAYGTPTEDSDVDLLVVLPFEEKTAKKATEISLAVRANFPIDLIPITPTRLQERLDMGDFFIREITERGKVLHASDHAKLGG